MESIGKTAFQEARFVRSATTAPLLHSRGSQGQVVRQGHQQRNIIHGGSPQERFFYFFRIEPGDWFSGEKPSHFSLTLEVKSWPPVRRRISFLLKSLWLGPEKDRQARGMEWGAQVLEPIFALAGDPLQAKQGEGRRARVVLLDSALARCLKGRLVLTW